MQTRSIAAIIVAALVAAGAANAATVTRTPFKTGEGAVGSSKMVGVDNYVFPSAFYGTHGDVLAQVDEIVQKADAALKTKGLGIGDMVQHTIYLKNGAAAPVAVLNRFHAMARGLAPGLVAKPSVGTIVRVPEFADPNTLVAVDIVAGGPKTKAGPSPFDRTLFIAGPKEIAETIADDQIVFTAGIEAMDFAHGTLVPTIEEQVPVIVAKLRAALKRRGLGLGNMISHNLYVTKGTDPMTVITLFHKELRKFAPTLAQYPSVGTLAVVDGMAAPGFLLEMDAVAVKGDPSTYKRALPPKMPADVARAVSVGSLIHLGGMDGTDSSRNDALSSSVNDQIDMVVKKIDAALKASGSSFASLIKAKLYVVKGAGDPEKIRARFNAAAIRLAPALKDNPPAEALIVVEGLDNPAMKFEATTIAAQNNR